MKAFLLLSFALSATAITAPQFCLIPTKYAASTTAGCTGPQPGYVVTGYCQNVFHPNPADIALAPTRTVVLTTANAAAFTPTNPAIPNRGCGAPTANIAWLVGAGGFTATLIDAVECGPAVTAGLPVATGAAMTATKTTEKGINIVCDTANQYYASAGVEGSAYCAGAAASASWLTTMLTTAQGIYDATWGKQPDTRTASWMSGALTCSQACVVPAAFCATNTFHANVVAWGTGLVAGTCFMQPGTTASFYCRSDPFTLYTATCTANAVSTTAGTVSFAPGTPDCGGVDGASTGFYINQQADGTTTQTAGQVVGYTATSTLAKSATATFGQWGGYPRALVPFQTASTYKLTITGCPTDAATRGACVQAVVNWWRCRGLTIDSATACYANSVRIACPQHTNGFRCPDSSKKGLLGLLGLLGLIPLLACLVLLCVLLLCLCRPKKRGGDVNFATFDPQAGAVAGSVAPGTACYAPSIGGPGVY